MKKDQHLAIIIAIGRKKPMSKMANDDMNDDSSDNSGDNGFAGHEMHNVICLDDSAYPSAKDGDEVETTVKGKIVEHDGKKYLVAEEADGKPVMSIEDDQEEASESPEEEASEGDDSSSPDDQGGVSEARNHLKDVISKGYGKNMFT